MFIIHRPYFQQPDTNYFWTQDHVFEWFTTPHPSILEQDERVQKEHYNFLCELNHQPAPHRDISHTSLGPQHDIIMIPTPLAIHQGRKTRLHWFSLPRCTRPMGSILAIKPTSSNLQQTPPTHASDDPTNKASSSTTTGSKEHPSSSWRKIFCPWPPCRPDHEHPPETSCPSLKVFFSKDKDETDSSSDEDYMNLSSLWFMQDGIIYFFKVCNN